MAGNARSKDIVAKLESKFKVLKRDGRTEDFKSSKVKSAIKRALINGGRYKAETAETDSTRLTASVCNLVAKTGDTLIKVDALQDIVIRQLWADNLDEVATHYTLYKEDRKRARESDPIDPALREMIAKDSEHFGEPIQYFQLMTKFARWREDKKRRETWQEACERIMGWLKKQPRLKKVEKEAWEELYNYLYNQQASPAMRVVQMAGPPLDRCNVGVFNCSYMPITDLFSFVELLYILMQGTGAGFSVEDSYIEHLPRIKRQKGGDKKKHTVEDSTEGWCDALKLGLETWFEGDDVEFDFSKVRPAGAILKTKGGRSCGPEPLKDLLRFAKDLIIKRQGKYLTQLDCHDLACMVGKIVQVGGVRRAALISLSDLDSEEMRNAKSGAWWQNHVYRSMANNSAVYDEKPDAIKFMDEWLSLAKSGSGERGLFNRDGVLRMLPKRRKKAKFGTNPCFHGDTRIATEVGLIRIADLANDGRAFKVAVDNRNKVGQQDFRVNLMDATPAQVTQKNVMTYKVTTEHGNELIVTDNHEFPTNRGRLQLKDIRVGDTLMLQSDEGFFGMEGNYSEGLVMGIAAGAGHIEKEGQRQTMNIERFFDNVLNAKMLGDCKRAINRITTSGSVKLKELKSHKSVKLSGTLFTSKLQSMCGFSSVASLKMEVPEEIMRGSRGMVAGYLVGLLSSGGVVQRVKNIHNKRLEMNMVLTSESHQMLLDVQKLLLNFGVVSKIRRASDRSVSSVPLVDEKRKSNVEAYCLIVNNYNCATLVDRVGLDGASLSQLIECVNDDSAVDKLRAEEYTTTIKSIEEYYKTDVYCLNQPATHNLLANGVVAGNCAEIILRPNEFCNLSIAVARPDDTAESLANKVRVASIFGTLQATCTNFKYIREAWHKNCEEEALLGVDITGQMDCPLLRPGAEGRDKLLQDLRDLAVKTNEEWAKKLGINRAAAVTCVKPSGDSAQFFNCGSGIHAWFGKYFIRRVRERADSPVARMLIDQGVPHIVAPEDPSLVCFEFPRKAPEGALTRHDQTAVEQLDNWLSWKRHWAEHSVSATVYVDPHEWLETGAWVHRHFDEISGVSFLPRDNGTYTGTPYEEITEEEYTKRMAELPKIDWSKLIRYETEDNTTGSQEFACVAGGCNL
jgi:ribonucleotide reductase class II